MNEKTYPETLREALAHEKAGRWRAASDAWARAANLLGASHRLAPGYLAANGGARRGLLSEERVRQRCEAAGLRQGDELRHTKHGAVKATAFYRGPREIEYGGTVYDSLTAAARAAARDLGLRPDAVAGWHFWGLERQEQSVYAAQASEEAAA